MTTAADPRIYPAPRNDRDEGEEGADLGSIVAPRMRIIPFMLQGTLNLRTSASIGPFQGPAIVKEVTISCNNGSDPPVSTVELGKARLVVTENAVALATPRPYEVLTELFDPGNQIVASAGQGWPQHSVPGTATWKGGPLDLIVLDTEFFIVLALIAPTATAARFPGQLRILEGVDAESLRFFL